MEKAKIRATIIEVLKQVQATSGKPCPDITDVTKPIGDIEGFDSLLAVESTVLLEHAFGCKLADGTPFISADGTKALRVPEVIDRVLAMIVPERAA